MYELKQKLLFFCKPTCIHKEFIGFNRIRTYDYQKKYKNINDDEVVWQNCYYDYDKDREVWFKDVEDINNPIYHYYLFYDFDKRSFHSPISELELIQKKYSDLKILEIDQIITYGKQIDDLMSMQFVRKVLEVLEETHEIQ